jgi:hypothetical protein
VRDVGDEEEMSDKGVVSVSSVCAKGETVYGIFFRMGTLASQVNMGFACSIPSPREVSVISFQLARQAGDDRHTDA